ncbi:hypothetical protein X925_10290 [Petrotoga sp. 9T1HF07.CasAA.8.2]|nr:hypothetical protein X925_10290 [Petrotoga sp. 9T1HF07.CasAA.8.2]
MLVCAKLSFQNALETFLNLTCVANDVCVLTIWNKNFLRLMIIILYQLEEEKEYFIPNIKFKKRGE